MKQMFIAILVSLLLFSWCLPVHAEAFCDTRFQGMYTTDNLDAIIRAYELYNNWYWTSQAGVIQSFHGQEGKPGWTDTAVNVYGKKDYIKGWYGCRWGKEEINPRCPNDYGYGECFGFLQFVGYLLSGERNPHGKWKSYDSLQKAGGLKVGDILRAEYQLNGRRYMHSAMVYSINGDTVTFFAASGSHYNLISVGQGYSDGNLKNETSLKKICSLPGLRICRSPDNAH